MNWRTALAEFGHLVWLAPQPAPVHGAGFALPSLPASEPSTPLLVVVNDPDRDTDSVSALFAIASASASRPLRVLVATGSHTHTSVRRQAHERPLRVAAPTAELRWHDGAEDVSSPGGTCDPWFAEAQDVVGIGSVEPHWFAGLTGSYKTLSIGVMPRHEIARSHRLATSDAARPLVLSGNPVHEEIARTFRALTAGKTVLGIDALGSHTIAGDPEENLRAHLPAARARWGRAVARPLDFLISRVRPPLDRSLYQADKGIKNSEHAVRDGGAIVLDAACTDGVGQRRFVDLLAAAPDAATACANIERDGYRLGDHKAVRLRVLQERGVAIGLVGPGLPESDARAAGITLLDGPAEAASWLRERVGTGANGAIVEDAGNAVVHVSA